jgi:hypothetical protein
MISTVATTLLILAPWAYWQESTLLADPSSQQDSHLIGKNQLPVSATMWHHRSQIYFVTFISWKIRKLLITQQTLKPDKK